MITLWHCSRTGLKGPIQPISATDSDGQYILHDFGIGFYAYDMLETARIQQPHITELSKIEFRGMDTLENLGCRVHVFRPNLGEILDWALYVAYNRGFFREDFIVGEDNTGAIIKKPAGEQYPHCHKYYTDIASYDIIIGPIADGIMQYAYQCLIEERLGIRGLSEVLEAASLGSQMIFKTQKACDALNQYSLRTVSGSPWIFRETLNSLGNRELELRKKVILANRQYRGSGKDRYIDKLLAEKESKLQESIGAPQG